MTAALPERFGRFRVLAELGRGAMGVVYRAEDSALGRTVAIKTIALTGTPQERDLHEGRFLQEARAAGSVSHPTIITIYDVGREGDVAFIAMELLEGVELKQLVQGGSLRPSQALSIVAAVADGLDFAHQRGVIHRDIKPGNIMVLDDGRVKLMDFGIARLQAPTVRTQTGMMLGSPQYMSPEQISGHGIDHRSDIFSLGLVLYELLTGAKPFRGDDVSQLLFAVANLPARAPSQLNGVLPPVVDYIVARALKKKPEERYATAAELAADLRAAVPEVEAAERSAVERTRSGTEPLPGSDAQAMLAPPRPVDEIRLELQPSPRFDSVEGLARLAVLPAEGEESRSRAGWTVGVPRRSRRLGKQRGWVLAAYFVAFLATVFLVSGCGPGGPRIAKLGDDAVVLAFGDSLTYGTGAGTGESYPAQLERRIGRRVVNAGVPGETSAQGLARLPAAIDEVKPRLLILTHGGNDFLRRLDERAAASNVRRMIEEARAKGVDVVLVATPKPGLPPSIPVFYAQIAAELAVPFEESAVRAVLLDSRLKSDLVHPNAQGYAKIAEALEDLLEDSGAI